MAETAMALIFLCLRSGVSKHVGNHLPDNARHFMNRFICNAGSASLPLNRAAGPRAEGGGRGGFSGPPRENLGMFAPRRAALARDYHESEFLNHLDLWHTSFL
jgi:hypothetical protein